MSAAPMQGVERRGRVISRRSWSENLISSSLPKPFEMDILLLLIKHLFEES
jgi:hypothetical protein